MDSQKEYDMIMNLFIKNKECIIDKRYNTLNIKNQDKIKKNAYSILGDYIVNSNIDKLLISNPVLLSNTINGLYQNILYKELLIFLNIEKENKLKDYYEKVYDTTKNDIVKTASETTLLF